MSIIKNYQEGKTELNKLKFKSNMGDGHPGRPPLIQKRIPTESKEASPLAGTEIGRRLDDVGRIAQLFIRREGLGFLANNLALNNTTGPQSYLNKPLSLQERSQLSLANLTFGAKDTLLTLASTLASIPVSGTGVHFVKGALERRAYLEQPFIKQNTASNPSPIQKRQSNLPDPQLKQYYFTPQLQRNSNELTPEDFADKPEDWKNSYKIYKNTTNIPSNDRTKVTLNIGEPGTSKVKYDKDGLFYDRESDKTAIDNINAKQPFTNRDEVQDDYVKFLFEILPIDSSDSTFLQFRSYIDSFDDSYNASWSEIKYIGRGESFYNYTGFNRSLNISFKSAASTRAELLPMYEKLNFLASTTAPTYSASQIAPGIMRGTVVRMTIGNYINDTPGFLSSVQYSWRNGYQWEIKDNVLPHVLDCTISFTPIHTFVPTALSNQYIATNEQV